MDITVYDIAIVGSGIACSMTLCQLAERLKNMPIRGKSLRIGILEKEGEMWNGIPYGRRSSLGALAFQRLQEFLEEPERSCYIEWLAANAASWLKTLRDRGGPGAAKWILDNQSLMEREKWEELYLPRFLFGLYVSSHADRAVEELSRSRLASVTLIHGEAIGISRIPDGLHTIMVEDKRGGRSQVHAARVVLSIGSPPQRPIYAGSDAVRDRHSHIANIYSPSEDVSMQKIQQVLSSLPDRRMANILIVGSNASALEVLYIINYRLEIRHLVNSVVVLSRSGLLPYKICQETISFELTALNYLLQSSYFSAADLMAAITCDISKAEELKLNIADLRDPVGAAVSRLISLMHVSEQKKFVCEHGVHFSRMMRRAGRDTRNAADELASVGILTTVKGELRRLEPSPGNGVVSAVYASARGAAEITHPTPFSITINCGGFEDLDFSTSPLINSLIDNAICTANSTNRGFVVNDRLEASENVYVIGPLVGGNFNDRFRFWHVESASRIAGLAKLLAESLTDSLFPPSEYPLPDTVGREARMAVSVGPRYL